MADVSGEGTGPGCTPLASPGDLAGQEVLVSQEMAYRAGLTFLAGGLPGQAPQHLARWNGNFYRWTGSHYRPCADEDVKASVTRWLARHSAVRARGPDQVQEVTEPFVRDVMLAVRTETEIGADVQPGSWLDGPPEGAVGPFLATPTGVIDLGRVGDPAARPLPSSPRFFTLSALPVTPDPSGSRTAWDRFVTDTFADNPAAVGSLQERFGYCLWPDCRYEKFFLFFGPGNSGKSTGAETLQGLLGEANVAALPLERFGERFALAGLVGKFANIVFDASEIERMAEGVLKALVSGEPVTVEQKHQPVGTMRLTAKHFFLANVLPRFRDTSTGLWRRLDVLPFDRVCPEGQRDPRLKERLRAELPGIAAWALQGLARLRERGRFTSCPRGQVLLAEYRQASNPVALFLAEECLSDGDGRVGRQLLYARYREWAEASGQAWLSRPKFYDEVRALYPQPESPPRESRGQDRVFVGFRLRERPDILQQIRTLSAN
jgi:putative DNA primase/helicase